MEDTNQQLKKWMLGWQPVVDHSMKRVKELAKENIRPILRHFTADKTSKDQRMEESNKASYRQHKIPTRMSNNPLTNVFERLSKKRSLENKLMMNMFKTIGKKSSTSRLQMIQEVEEQMIEDRYGDAPS